MLVVWWWFNNKNKLPAPPPDTTQHKQPEEEEETRHVCLYSVLTFVGKCKCVCVAGFTGVCVWVYLLYFAFVYLPAISLRLFIIIVKGVAIINHI